MGDSIWNELYDKWGTPQFKQVSDQKIKNLLTQEVTLAHLFTLEVLFQQ